MGSKKPSKLDILKIKDLKITNRNHKKANKQDIDTKLTATDKIIFSCHYNHLTLKPT